jgi:hypothetical protein
MATINGIGTMYYGWRHSENQPSTATKWFTLFYLPILPLGRYALEVLTDFSSENLVSTSSASSGGVATQYDYIKTISKTPLAWKEIARTYINAYILLPLLVTWPIPLIFVILPWLFSSFPELKSKSWIEMCIVIPSIVLLISNAILIPVYFLRKARGFKGGFIHQNK